MGHTVLRIFLWALLGLGISIGWSCKPAVNESALQTLENFAAQKRIKENSCSGRTNDRHLPTVKEILANVDGTTDIEMETEIAKSVSAIPETVRSMFAALGGRIRVTSNPGKFCGNARGGNEAKYETYACFVFRELKKGGGVAIVLKDHPDAVGHSLVRQFGYFYSQYLSQYKFKYDSEGNITSAKKQRNEGLFQRKVAVANAFIADVAQSPYFKLSTFDRLLAEGAGSKMATALKKGKANVVAESGAKKSRQLAFIDYVFAEAFDSFYCNAYAPVPEDLFKGVKAKQQLSLTELAKILEGTDNSRMIMSVMFDDTLKVWNVIHPELFLYGPSDTKSFGLTGGPVAGQGFALTQGGQCGVSMSPTAGERELAPVSLTGDQGTAPENANATDLFGNLNASGLPVPPAIGDDQGAINGGGGNPAANRAMADNLSALSDSTDFNTNLFREPVFATPAASAPSTNSPLLNSATANAQAWGAPEPALPSATALPASFGNQVANTYPEPLTVGNATLQSGGDFAQDFSQIPPQTIAPASVASPAPVAAAPAPVQTPQATPSGSNGSVSFGLSGPGFFKNLGKKCGELFGRGGDEAAEAADAIRTGNRALENAGDLAGTGARQVDEVFENADQANRLARLAGRTIPDEVPARLEPVTPDMLKPGDDAIFFSKSGNMYTGTPSRGAVNGQVPLSEGSHINLDRIGEGGIMRKGDSMTFTSKSGNQYSGIVTNAHPESKMVQIMTDSGEYQWLKADRLDFAQSGMRGRSIDPKKFERATEVAEEGAGYSHGPVFSGYRAPGMEDIPDQGWKFHVSAQRGMEGDVAEAVLPELRKMGIQHKVANPDGYGRLFATDAMGKPGTQKGKLVTIYARNEDEARQVAKVMRDRMEASGLAKQDFVKVPGEREIAPGVFARYGQFRAGPDLPSGNLRGPNGDLVPDTRGQYKPDWVPDLNLD